jgi:hypothetical protein
LVATLFSTNLGAVKCCNSKESYAESYADLFLEYAMANVSKSNLSRSKGLETVVGVYSILAPGSTSILAAAQIIRIKEMQC